MTMTTTTTRTMTYQKADDEIEIFDHRQPPQALCNQGFSELPDYPVDDCCAKWLENMCADLRVQRPSSALVPSTATADNHRQDSQDFYRNLCGTTIFRLTMVKNVSSADPSPMLVGKQTPITA